MEHRCVSGRWREHSQPSPVLREVGLWLLSPGVLHHNSGGLDSRTTAASAFSPEAAGMQSVPAGPGSGSSGLGGGADPLPLGSYWVLSGHSLQFSSAQSLSRVRLCDPWTAAHQASLFITNSRSLPKLMSTESVMPSNHLILCRPLLLLPSTWPSIRVFSSESALHMKWPKYWSFSLSISPSNEHPGLISFRMEWLDLLAVHGTLKSLLQHHSSKASILWRSAFFRVQLSHPYMTTGKTIDDYMDLC